ncbi:AraC family transcriptional regulator [Breoghania corrubedonensis]|uniref:AraC family transcriptional regulator n=1 Tax=Breoghania corrubedonensis TaxID=665038 RepID=A0A2T5UW03_9HYPH|nr:AraC family transcriptional regulator [Breoghania corrubedonensis]PTW55696.1 AraC family transcriptional regulator [Breoghania corrubedonensis]
MHFENDQSGRMGTCFGLQDSPCISLAPAGNHLFTATLLKAFATNANSRLVVIPPQDAYLLTLYLEDTRHCDVSAANGEGERRTYRKGTICLIDLQEGASIRLFKPLDAICIHLPYGLIADLSCAHASLKPGKLRCLRGFPDKVVWNIGQALRSQLEPDIVSNPEMLNHVAVALCSHLLHAYRAPAETGGASFSPFEVKEVLEYLTDHFSKHMDERSLGRRFGLSAAEFSVRFKALMGCSLAIWLTHYRLDRAKELLKDLSLPVSDVIRMCGLHDDERFRRELQEFSLGRDTRTIH